MLDKAEQDAIRQIVQRDKKEGFLNTFERDLLVQILNRQAAPGTGSAVSSTSPPPSKP